MNTSHIRLSFASLAALAAIACGSAPASAGDEYVTHSVKVSFADLNLSSEAGAATLYQRIRGAARTVCSPNPGERPPERYRDWKQCYETAINNAVGKVNSPLLSALHSSKAPATAAAPRVVAATIHPETSK
jgi:UrcA family protein